MVTVEELQEEVQALRELVQASYKEPRTNEYSFPVVGQAVTDSMWQQITLGMGSGILDQGGQPYWLRNLDNATNTAVVTVSKTTKDAQAIIRGFFHRMKTDMKISLPPVSSPTTYYVVLEYDPLGHASETGPISLKVKTALTTAQGKVNLLLWEIPRLPNQLLTDAVVIQKRPKIAPSMTVDTKAQLPQDMTGVLWGTTMTITDGVETGNVYRATGADQSGWPQRWENDNDRGWKPITLLNAYESFTGEPPQYRVLDGMVELRGAVKHTTGRDLYTNEAKTFGYCQGVEMDYVSIPIAASNWKFGRLEITRGKTGVMDNLMYGISQTGIRWVRLDGVRIPLKSGN